MNALIFLLVVLNFAISWFNAWSKSTVFLLCAFAGALTTMGIVRSTAKRVALEQKARAR
jgi:hypothetical protein